MNPSVETFSFLDRLGGVSVSNTNTLMLHLELRMHFLMGDRRLCRISVRSKFNFKHDDDSQKFDHAFLIIPYHDTSVVGPLSTAISHEIICSLNFGKLGP